MPKLKCTISCLTFLLCLTAPLASAQTGNPYYNVLDPAYGAKCDGHTRDTAAFQSALNAAQNNGGGVVFVPSTVTSACVIDTQLNMDRFSGVSLSGPPAGNTGLAPSVGSPATNPHPTILFTGSSTPLISMKTTVGVSLQNLTLQYNNANLSGPFIDLSHASGCPPLPSGSCSDSDMDYIGNCTIQGTADVTVTPIAVKAAGANPLINLNGTINVTIERNIFEWAVNGIMGQAAYPSDVQSNAIHIRNNMFSGYGTNSISGNMILNLGTGWVIDGNTFEMGGPDAYFPIPINGNTVGCFGGCVISGNWIGDTQASYHNFFITGTFFGTSISGNYLSGCISANGCISPGGGIQLNANSTGVSITGNDFVGVNVGVYFPNSFSPLNILISGNNYVSVNASSSGLPSSGIITDMSGTTTVFGRLSKSSGSFTIDHPLDPENKYLSHSFVESPDMMNIYNGIAVLDSCGRAEVKLPSYFEALNQDFRYQLTPVSAYAPVYIARKIKGNSFRIAGGRPSMEVSWQVTGIRHDPYANAHRIIVEEDKPKSFSFDPPPIK